MNAHHQTLTPEQAERLRVFIDVLRDALGVGSDPAAMPRHGIVAYLESPLRFAEVAHPGEQDQASEHRRQSMEALRALLGHLPALQDLDAAAELFHSLEADLRDFIQHDLEAGPGG